MAKTVRRNNSVTARLDALAETIGANHLETCQRLTALETQFSGVPDRVSTLEKFQNRALGALTLVSVFVVLITEWIRKHI